MERRTFLKQLAATPLIFGLGNLLSQEEGNTPGWYREALAKMKQTGRYGIVLVVPGGNPMRATAEEALSTALATQPPHLFCEAVFIVLVRKLADRLVGETGERENRILLDPAGKRVAADRVALVPLLQGNDFSPSFERFLHGKDNLHLRRQVREMKVPKKLRDALKKIDSDRIGERTDAEKILRAAGDNIMPALALLRITTGSEEIQARIDAIRNNHSGCTTGDTNAPVTNWKLPYGVSPAFPGLKLATKQLEPDSCLGCGMARIDPESRPFLKIKSRLFKIPVKFHTR